MGVGVENVAEDTHQHPQHWHVLSASVGSEIGLTLVAKPNVHTSMSRLLIDNRDHGRSC